MTLLERLQKDEILMALGAYDAISAKVAEQSGAETVYMSGSSVASSVTGASDVGLATMTEVINRAREITGTIDVPLISDADTGYGNPINVQRTVREFERAGVSAIHIEDQTFPKKCGHFEGKTVINADEYVQKIQAAVDARESDDFLIIARTDANAVNGIEDAIRRAKMAKEAGADVIFVEAPETTDQMRRVTDEVPGFHLANIATGGKTPILNASELQDIGYDISIYAAEAFRGALKAYQRIYSSILENGSQKEVTDLVVSWDERNEITGLAEIYEREQQYSTE